jgi:cephalosporin hydroxylase
MRQSRIDTELLGPMKVACDQCGREILLSEDRNYCSKCRKDLCLDCRTCSTAGEHQLVTYRGFREVRNLDVVLAKAEQYLNESCGSHLFHVEENIYLAQLHALLGFLQVNDDQLVDLESLSTSQRRFVQDHGERLLRDWVSLRDMGRFVEYFDRRAFAGRLPGFATYIQSQGSYAPISWKGKSMMRTVWDFALSAIMVQEIKPQTIVELGTASGASAIWHADLQRLHGLTPRVITMDIRPPSLQYEGVTFLKGDSNAIEEVLSLALLRGQPHPWIVIEDSHVNILGILNYLHGSFHTGDYIIIEDIDAEDLLVDFLSKHKECYRVDARYTDFFGHNATCAADQILCRIA